MVEVAMETGSLFPPTSSVVTRSGAAHEYLSLMDTDRRVTQVLPGPPMPPRMGNAGRLLTGDRREGRKGMDG